MLQDALLFCLFQSLVDKDGKKCLFIIKCADKSFEISASDKKKKQEWIQGTDWVHGSAASHLCWMSISLCLRLSCTDVHPAAEVGAVVSSPRGAAEAPGAPAEAAGGGGRPGGGDEEASGGQWEQTERAGGHEAGLCITSTQPEPNFITERLYCENILVFTSSEHCDQFRIKTRDFDRCSHSL